MAFPMAFLHKHRQHTVNRLFPGMLRQCYHHPIMWCDHSVENPYIHGLMMPNHCGQSNIESTDCTNWYSNCAVIPYHPFICTNAQTCVWGKYRHITAWTCSATLLNVRILAQSLRLPYRPSACLLFLKCKLHVSLLIKLNHGTSIWNLLAMHVGFHKSVGSPMLAHSLRWCVVATFPPEVNFLSTLHCTIHWSSPQNYRNTNNW